MIYFVLIVALQYSAQCHDLIQNSDSSGHQSNYQDAPPMSFQHALLKIFKRTDFSLLGIGSMVFFPSGVNDFRPFLSSSNVGIIARAGWGMEMRLNKFITNLDLYSISGQIARGGDSVNLLSENIEVRGGYGYTIIEQDNWHLSPLLGVGVGTMRFWTTQRDYIYLGGELNFVYTIPLLTHISEIGILTNANTVITARLSYGKYLPDYPTEATVYDCLNLRLGIGFGVLSELLNKR
jgi:hypothetical protein